MNNRRTILTFLALVGIPSLATADNAALTTGGQPQMLSSHRSVSMASEIVRIVVHWDRVDTDCSFDFVNHGKACTVNMGFPDFGLLAYAYQQKKPTTMFRKYQSFVDGKSVRTKLVLGKKPGEQWQTKTVAFAANGKRTAREIYSTEVGGVGVKPPWGLVCYLLHTGASWNGNIGKATILVTFDEDSEVKTPLNISVANVMMQQAKQTADQITKPGGLVVSGPGTPSIQGRTLTFTRQNWRPTMKDDILIAFLYPDRAMKAAREKYGK